MGAQVPKPDANDLLERWKEYWKTQDQSWRTEAEIDTKRQRFLAERCATIPDDEQNIYPLRDVQLSRADIEWLLVMRQSEHELLNRNGGDSHDWRGIDIRGADLRQIDLRALPLSGMCAGFSKDRWYPQHLGPNQIAATHLEGADLREAHLERAILRETYMSRVNLRKAHLEGTDLRYAHLEGANLRYTHLGGKLLRANEVKQIGKWVKSFPMKLLPADLREAFFDEATNLGNAALGDGKFGFVSLADIRWGNANLSYVDWGPVKILGDEQQAQQKKNRQGKTKEKEIRLAEYKEALRANRQLAVVLRNQGLSEEADHFAYRAQKLQRIVLQRLGLLARVKLWQRVLKLSGYIFSLFLDLLAGYGYKPARSVFWYLIILFGFTTAYSTLGHLPLLPDALVYSMTSFHGRGFFPGLETKPSLHDPLVVLAAFEAVIGLFIEISFIATFTQRFFGR